ncbi:MAG TPA: hypothetical protein VKU91_05360, partial [Acidimicrobiales bacterium]|nr:hypothetical protein [Acidimicrobiales bacterium]
MAVGYVLGARSGRQRYDQISQLADKVADLPLTQQIAGAGRRVATGQGEAFVNEVKQRWWPGGRSGAGGKGGKAGKGGGWDEKGGKGGEGGKGAQSEQGRQRAQS